MCSEIYAEWSIPNLNAKDRVCSRDAKAPQHYMKQPTPATGQKSVHPRAMTDKAANMYSR